ncbi:MAG: S8 family serine peptidase [Bacteroidales bacterium]|nr:S8 family serine peptidase [Bacteroidales bacterium]
MKKLLLAVLLCFAFVGLKAQTLDPNYIDGHLYFKFVDSYDFRFVVNEDTRIEPSEMKQYSNLFTEYGVTLITRPLYAFNDPVTERIIRLEFSQYKRINEFIAALEALPEVEYAERVPLPKLLYNDPLSSGSWGTSYGPYQWNLTMINASGAWTAQVASSSIKVAVVDGAVWGAHPDLNISSSNMCSYGSGYASVGNSAPPTSVSQTTSCSYNNFYNNNCPAYDWSHGTHCAGMVAAKNNNGIGISSIGGGDGSNGSGLTLMGVRAANNNDQLYYTSNGVAWAVNNGAKVVSMSYGSTSSSNSERSAYQSYYNNGVVLVAAAGNDGDGSNEINYPAGYSCVISVASVDNSGKISSFSEHGAGRADIAAPGGFYNANTGFNNILSTTYCVNQWHRINGFNNLQGQYYDGMQGTSMACPTVAGLCGLMLSAYPQMTPAQVKNCLQSTAHALAAGSQAIDGNGYIDAQAAVNCAKSLAANLRANPAEVAISSRGGSKTVEVTSANSISTNWSATSDNAAFTVSPSSGSGNGATTTMTITAANPNETGAPITGTITITQGTGGNRQTATISVTQNDQSDLCITVGPAELFEHDSTGLNVTGQYYAAQYNMLFGQRIVNSRPGTVDSITIGGYYATASSGSVTAKIYDDNNGVPGTQLASKTIQISALRSAGDTYTPSGANYTIYYGFDYGVKLDQAVEVSGNYYIIFDFSGVTAVSNNYDCWFFDLSDQPEQANYNNGVINYNGNWRTGSLFGMTYYDIMVSAHFCESNDPYVVVTPTTVPTDPLMGVEEVEVNSNTDWTTSTNCDWVTVSPSSGSDGSTVSIITAENMGDERSCDITFTYEGGSTTITVNQMAHQTGCDEMILYDDTEFGWRVNDAQTALQWDEDSTYFYAFGLDNDNTRDSGYYMGVNVYGDKAKANFIPVYGTANVTGVTYLYTTVGTGGSVTFKVWDGSTGEPGTVLASKTVTMSSLSSSSYYEWEFDTPLDVTGSVFVGADFSSVTSGSYICFYSNYLGASDNSYAVELQSDDQWYPFWGGSYTATAAMFPALCYNGSHTHIDLAVNVMDNDTTNVITAMTLNAGDVLAPVYVISNTGEATYIDSTKIFITLDDFDYISGSLPPLNFISGGYLPLKDTIATMSELRAMGYNHNDVVNLCYRVAHTNTTYDWTDTNINNNTSCVAVTINCPPVINNMTQTSCESYSFNGETYTTSGTYRDTLTTVNGCDSIITLNLTINHGTHNAQTVSECDSYTWNGGSYALSGDYTYSYTNANNCQSVDTLHLTITTTPTITVDGNLTINPGQTTTLTASGATSYVWKNNGTTVSTSNPFTTPALNTTTVYTVEGTTGNCSGMASVTVTVQAAQPTNGDTTVIACDHYTWARTGVTYTSSAEPTYTLVNGNAQGADSIITLHLTINPNPTINVSGNTNIYIGQTTTLTASGANTYTWAAGGANVSTNNPYTTPALNSTTIYTVSGTDANNCTGSTNVTVNVTSAPATNGDTSVVACGSYTWARTGVNYTASAEPTYTLSGGNANGGDSIITLHLTINPNPTINVDGNTSIYIGQTTTLTASGANTYTWATGGANVSTNNPYTTAALNSTTIYTVSGTDANNCTGSTTVTVNVTSAPATNGDTTVVACGSYTWARTGINYTASAEPTYTLSGGNANGGDSIITLHLTINPNPTINVSGNTDIYIGQTTTLTASGANTYVWTTGGANVSTNNPYTTAALNSTTIYTVSGTDANNCTGSTTVTVNVTSAPATYGDTSVIACGSYTWARTGVNYTASAEPTYTISGGNANGGDSIITLHLTINPNPTIVIDGETTITSGQSTTLTASGATSYVWTENGNTVATTASYTASPATNTTYTVTGTDANNCVNTQTVTVIVSSPATVYDTTIVTACNSYEWNGNTYDATGFYQYAEGNNVHVLDLTINPNPTINIDGNTSIYIGQTTTLTASGAVTYVWATGGADVSTDNPYTTSALNSTTTYTVTGTDANTCVGTAQITVTVSQAAATNGDTTAVACDQYTWRGSTYNTSGDYTFTIPGGNVNGGDSIITLHLTINPNPTITVDGNISIYIGQTTTLTASGAATYVWATGGNNVSTDNPYTTSALNTTTIYTVTGTDANTCVGTTQVTVTVSQAGSTNRDTTAVACDQYTWRGSTYNTTGNYTYTIPGGNYLGGDSIITLHLTINPNPTITVDGNISIYIGQTTTLTASGAATYTWAIGGAEVSTNNPYTTPALNTTTTYTVTGTDANTCVGSTQVTVTVSQAGTTTGDTNAIACDNFTWYGQTFRTSGNYTHTFPGGNYLGGDSILTLHLTINPNPTISVDGNTSIYIGQSTTLTASGAATYVWATGGNNVSSSNPYTTATLNNTTIYNVTGTDANNCVGSTQVTVQVSQAPQTTGDTNAIACDSFTWYGQTYNISGNYTHVMTNYLGGDSIVTLHLTINNSTTAVEQHTACDSYTWHGVTYTESNNTATFTTTGSNGCDLVTTLNLTINNSTSNEMTATSCDTYFWPTNGMTYNTSGNYNYTTTGSNGCPNVTTLHLTINQSTTADASATACDTYTWPLNGQVYSTSGNYSYTTTGSNGCPQTTTLHLTVNYSTSSNVTEEACDVYNWNGTQYTQSGTYMVNQTNSVGCTEVVTLHLTINPSTTEADQQTACDSYRWPTNNQTYTTSGNYTYTTVNEWGCPRIITLNLTINYSSENNIYDTVSAGSTYSNYGFYVPGNQTGVAIPGDVIELSHTGFYTAQHCDSTVYLHLTVTESQGGGEGIDDANGIAMKLYPNPASANVEIDCEGISALRVYDMTGRMLNEQINIVGNNAKVDVSNFAEGIYVFSITTQSGATAKQKVVVKH